MIAQYTKHNAMNSNKLPKQKGGKTIQQVKQPIIKNIRKTKLGEKSKEIKNTQYTRMKCSNEIQ